LAGAFLTGSIPFAHAIARTVAGADLRAVGTGTVSASGVYSVAGTLPFAAACLLDVGKGAISVALVRRRHPAVAALSAGLAIAGHNWALHRTPLPPAAK